MEKGFAFVHLKQIFKQLYKYTFFFKPKVATNHNHKIFEKIST